MSKRRESKAQQKDRLLLEHITEAQSHLVEGTPSHEVFEELLGALLTLTESEYGFIGEILTDEEGLHLKTHAITNIAWDEETQALYHTRAISGFEFRTLDSLFGHTIRTGEPLLTNAPATHPKSGGLPSGHPPLNSYLGLPFHSKGELIGMVGIANRAEGYDQALVAFLTPFLYTCANIIVTLRSERARAETFRRLQESEVRGRAILTHTIDAILTIDERGRIEMCNPATTDLFGYTREELIGQNISLLMPEPHRSRHDDYLKAYLETGRARVIGRGREVPGRRKNGESFEMELAVNAIHFEEQRIFMGVLRDISNRKTAEAKLTQLNAEMHERLGQLRALAADNAHLAELGSYLQTSHSEEEIYSLVQRYLSQTFEDDRGGFFVLSPEGEVDQVAGIGAPGAVEPIFDRWDCWALRRGEVHITDEVDERVHCLHFRPSEWSSSICVPVLTQDGLAGLISMSWRGEGRTKRRESLLVALADRIGASLSNVRLRRKLEDESIRDPLTRLYNRRYMHEYLRRQIRRAINSSNRDIAVLMLDIDHFKRFNDDYGHDIGDLALKAVAGVLSAHAKGDVVSCRLGGEEFLVIWPGTTESEAVALAERIRVEVSRLKINARHMDVPPITTSVGVAMFPEHADTEFDLLQSADLALYQAKHNGRDQVCVFHLDLKPKA